MCETDFSREEPLTHAECGQSDALKSEETVKPVYPLLKLGYLFEQASSGSARCLAKVAVITNHQFRTATITSPPLPTPSTPTFTDTVNPESIPILHRRPR